MNIHLIGNAHLDPVWLWDWHEGYAEVKATFRSALDRMKEFPEFKFTSACAGYYVWIKESDPAMFDEIRERVAEGRWCIVGGWYIQPDCNMPSGESFARHGLISQRFFNDNFGKMAKTGYNVDSFGHNGSIPMILKNSGMDNYVFMRPGPHEKNLPEHLFVWESDDGSKVNTYRIPIRYNITQDCFGDFADVDKMATKYEMMAFYGVGNHGGGPTIKLIEQMNKELDLNTHIYSTPDEYFEAVKDRDLVTIHDDLQFHAKGCYSAFSEVKTNNRKSENAVVAAEKYSVLSGSLLGTQYPAAEYERAWKNILFNHFHDILCGCSIKEAYYHAAIQHGEAQSIANRNTNFALQQIAWNIDTIGGIDARPKKAHWGAAWISEVVGTPIVVFNPHPWPVTEFVRIRENPKKITDSKGNVILAQVVRASKTNGESDHWEKGFIAEIPAYGYEVYRAYYEGDAPEFENVMVTTDTSIENDLIKLDFNPENGELKQITDKKTGKKLLSRETKTLLMDETHCDTWAHDIREFKNLAEVFASGSVKVTENGPAHATMRTTTKGQNSTVIRDYSITAGSDKITVKTKVDFHEKHRMLKFTFSANVTNPEVKCEIPFGMISRPTDGTEQTCHAWFAMKDENCGIAVLNDSKYSFDADGNTLSLTVLRSAIYADHFGKRDEFCEYMEQGIHEFTYEIMPFKSYADTVKKAAILNQPPFVVMETFHGGTLGCKYAGASVSEENIIITSVKKHEDSDAFVVRAYECEGKDTKVEISILGTTFTADFGHNQVKTFIVDNGSVRETNFLEY